MILTNDIIEIFNAQFLEEKIIQFNGDNNQNIIYDSESNIWRDSSFFKIIHFGVKNNIPSKILIFSNIQEAIFLLQNWLTIENQNYIVLISYNSVEQLLNYIYDNIILPEIRGVNFLFFQRENQFDGVSNLVHINNFYTPDKINLEYKNNEMRFSNNSISMIVNHSNFEQFLKPFIKISFEIKTINRNKFNYHLIW